ncbi:hypothetical protein VRB50_14125 [Pseudomonas poae]|uniref:hypothetical protein n=1 Tax=Pseudomonas poae TaxID=200451 RepID=UPI0030CB0A06
MGNPSGVFVWCAGVAQVYRVGAKKYLGIREHGTGWNDARRLARAYDGLLEKIFHKNNYGINIDRARRTF